MKYLHIEIHRQQNWFTGKPSPNQNQLWKKKTLRNTCLCFCCQIICFASLRSVCCSLAYNFPDVYVSGPARSKRRTWRRSPGQLEREIQRERLRIMHLQLLQQVMYTVSTAADEAWGHKTAQVLRHLNERESWDQHGPDPCPSRWCTSNLITHLI